MKRLYAFLILLCCHLALLTCFNSNIFKEFSSVRRNSIAPLLHNLGFLRLASVPHIPPSSNPGSSVTMGNLDLAQMDGGHYDEDAFFDNVEDSGAILDWWVSTDDWRSLLTELRFTDFDSKYGREDVLTLIKNMTKDLPADVNARFPANSLFKKRLKFYRLGDDAKQHINHLLFAASRKFGDDETRNRASTQKASVPSEASDNDLGSCSSSCAASWVNPMRSFEEATASYFTHLSSLDSEKPQIYNRRKFEDEFSLVWYK